MNVGEFPVGVAVLGWQQEYTAAHNFKSITLNDAPSVSWDLASGQVAKLTLGGSRTLANPTNPKDGGTYILVVTQGQAVYTLAYGDRYKWPNGVAPVIGATSGCRNVLTFVYDGTNMLGAGSVNYF